MRQFSPGVMRRACVAIMLALTALFAGALPTTARAENASAAKLFAPEDVRADFDLMYRRLQADAFDLYAVTPKAKLDRLHRRIRAEITHPLTRFEAEVLFERLAAGAHQGHTRVEGVYGAWAAYRKADGLGFPLTIRIKGSHVYVADNLSDVAQVKAGDEIVSLDGAPIRRWIERAATHLSAETPQMADSILEYDFAMYLWVAKGSRPDFRLTLRSTDGRPYQAKVPARSQAAMTAEAARRPPTLDLEHPLRDARMLPGGVAYLRPGPFYNEAAKTSADEWDVAGFRAFIDKAYRDFNAAGAQSLIVDLRDNPGGDSLFSDVMVSWIADRPYQFFSSFKIRVSPDTVTANRDRIAHDAVAAGPISQRFAALYASVPPGAVAEFRLPPSQPNQAEKFSGRVFALINRRTYSNAVAVAATIQDYRFGKVLGEPTSDMASAFGAMEHFTLPRTGIVVGYPKAHIIRPSGDARLRGVIPDVGLAFPVIETPNDPVLQQAAAIARR